jgi:hypothetical protein
MTKKLLIFILSLSICGQAFATLCYVEFEPGKWTYDNDIFSFEQSLEIQYAEGNTDLIGYTVNLPQLALVNNTIYPQGDLELFDNYGSKLFTANFEIGRHVDGLRTEIVFYDIDLTDPDSTYIVNDIELLLFSTGSKANTFEGNMMLTHIPEPATLLLLALGAVMVRRKQSNKKPLPSQG